jgi:hypothetical protein
VLEDLVTLRSFGDRMEAELAQQFLDAYGIRSMVQADDCGGMRPYLLLGFGGAQLRVLRKDVPEARELLDKSFPIPAAPPSPSPSTLPAPAGAAEEAAPAGGTLEPGPAVRISPKRRRGSQTDG